MSAFGAYEDEFVLCVEAAGHAPGFSVPFTLGSAEAGAGIEVRAAAAHAIEGTVVREDDGRPLAGAAIHFGTAVGQWNTPDWPPRYPPSGYDLVRTVTDAGGRFRIGDLGPGEYRVAAAIAGMAGDRATVTLPGAGPLRLAVRALHPLAGVVVDPEGRPVAGVEVRLRAPDGVSPPWRSVTLTDRAGAFRFVRVPAGDYTVVAVPDVALGPARAGPFPAGRLDVEVRLPRPRDIRGVLLDASGRPMEGVEVVARPEGGLLPIATAETDRDGAFRLWRLGESRYDVEFNGTGVTVTGAEAGSGLSYRLRGSLTIEGRVVSKLDSYWGLSLVLVALDPEPDPRVRRRHSAYPDDGGAFSFRHLPPGRYRIVLDEESRDRWRLPEEPVVTAGTTDVELLVEPGEDRP